jgi:ketosteroid isomerase-like protein
MEGEAAAVWAAMTAVYTSYLAGDRAAIDATIAPDASMWDSAYEPLVRGKEQLDAVRDARPADGPQPTGLRPIDPMIDVFGDTALVRHVLLVDFADAPAQRIRNTSVWRKVDGRWLCVHNHEDVVG